jgi:LPXTG-site transpeptidase (sortase) family protein
MQSPDGPTNVAWYSFSGKPGHGSNAVFSGHVDYIHYGAAVFWHLKDLVAGDQIQVDLDDGSVYTYAVVSINSISADPTEDELRDIVGASKTDIITLITCGGTFSQETHQYDHRTIVRAKRVLTPSTALAR